MKLGYICWLLGSVQRSSLLEKISPHFKNVVADHVTFEYGVSCLRPQPPKTLGFIVGEIIDKGVQALVVEIQGNTIRPDGNRYHITWSLDDGRFPQESIKLTQRGWWPFAEPIAIDLTPAWVEITSL